MAPSDKNPGRRLEDVVSTPAARGGADESHPAFGVAVVARSSGTGRTLFQSDMLHNQSITLSIRRAIRGRNLNRDWVHPREELIEVEMSLAQWGALVSSAGIGTGVPVTIRRTENVTFVPHIPYQPRIKASLDEVSNTVGQMVAKMRSTIVTLRETIEGKKGVRAVREALNAHEGSFSHAENNASYAVMSMADAAEKVASQARADIEAQILSAVQATGMEASVRLPELMLAGDDQFAIDSGSSPVTTHDEAHTD